MFILLGSGSSKFCSDCVFQEVESSADDCKQFAQMCQEAVKKFDCPVKKALDVMCSVGRFSYELSKFLEEVPYPPAGPYGIHACIPAGPYGIYACIVSL